MKKKLLMLMALMLNAPLASSAVLSLAPFSSNANTGDSLYVELNPSFTTVDVRPAIHIDPGFEPGVLTFINAVAGDFFISSAEPWIDELNVGSITTRAVRSTYAIDGTTGPDQPGVDFLKIETTHFNSLNNGALTPLNFTVPDVDNSAFSLTDTAILKSSVTKQVTGLSAMNVSASTPSSSPEPNGLFLLILGSLILITLALKNKWQYQVSCNIIFLLIVFYYYF